MQTAGQLVGFCVNHFRFVLVKGELNQHTDTIMRDKRLQGSFRVAQDLLEINSEEIKQEWELSV